MTELEVSSEHAADSLTRRVGTLAGMVGILLSVVMAMGIWGWVL